MEVSAPEHTHGPDRRYLTSVDARVECLCEAWPSIPAHIILAILSLADTAHQ
jgi:hypothetical protein